MALRRRWSGVSLGFVISFSAVDEIVTREGVQEKVRYCRLEFSLFVSG
jgi:hypothetical protein